MAKVEVEVGVGGLMLPMTTSLVDGSLIQDQSRQDLVSSAH